MMRTVCVVCAAMAMVLGGCSQGSSGAADRFDRGPGSWRTFPDATAEAVFDAARRAVSGEYRIGEIDRRMHMFRTVPHKYTSREVSGRLADGLSPTANTYREIATVRVSGTSAGETICHVRVEVQRLDTIVVEAFADQRQSSDIPSDRASMRSTSADPDRREAWTVVRRDRAAEQKILKDIAALAEPVAESQ